MAFASPATSTLLLGTSSLTRTTTSLPLPSQLASQCGLPHPYAIRPSRVRMAFSSIDDPSESVSLRDLSLETTNTIITACYKHVFGNAYLMESERAELAIAESDFRQNTLSVRELVRAMGKSEAYRKRFFARSGPYRFVELNCKHFLGRGPVSQEEVSFHVQKLMKEGYEAEIDSYIDSAEYKQRFGENDVPRFIYMGAYERNDDFNRLNIMRKHWDGCSTSTVSGSTAPGKPIPAQLTMGYGGYVNGYVGVKKGLPAGFRPEPAPQAMLPEVPTNPRAPRKVRVKVAENCYRVDEVPAVLPEVTPAWKKEREGVKRWNGVWF